MSLTMLSGFARGWFVVGETREIPDGGVKSLAYFGRKLVAYRTEEGALAVLDAHCPHLGADLGAGGRVFGGCIQCPFHAWTFGRDGACASIPYGEKVPRNARLRAWPVVERNGLIFVYHDPEGRAPDYEIPELPDHGRNGWSRWTLSLIRVKTQPREIVENVADRGHFPTVHGTMIDSFENEFDGPRAIQRSRGIAYPRAGGVDKFALTATYHGPAYQITEMESRLRNRLVLAHTPIDETSLDLRFGVSLRMPDEQLLESFTGRYIENLRAGFLEDIQIWEHKVWRDQPVLCDGDGPIMRLRRWYAQFYEPPEPGVSRA